VGVIVRPVRWSVSPRCELVEGSVRRSSCCAAGSASIAWTWVGSILGDTFDPATSDVDVLVEAMGRFGRTIPQGSPGRRLPAPAAAGREDPFEQGPPRLPAPRLVEQTRLHQQIAAHAAELAGAAGQVSRNADSAAAATEQMAQALHELTRTAQVTDGITSSVARKADRAAEVIRALESSSGQILAASDVIQAIAAQTNLLALNATIESARAGDAGRGFAVVATEVKDLARQSGNNADSITRTLAAVQAQVADAVAEISEITNSMAELSSHHGTLAAAIEEQSSAVAEVSRSTQGAAGEVASMADGIRALEKISHTSQ
jgi:hypothetical protein